MQNYTCLSGNRCTSRQAVQAAHSQRHASKHGSRHLRAVVELQGEQQPAAHASSTCRRSPCSQQLCRCAGAPGRCSRRAAVLPPADAARAAHWCDAPVRAGTGPCCQVCAAGAAASQAGAWQPRCRTSEGQQAGIGEAHTEGKVQAAQEGQAGHLAQSAVCSMEAWCRHRQKSISYGQTVPRGGLAGTWKQHQA